MSFIDNKCIAVGSKALFIGELTHRPKLLRARVTRNVTGLDLELFEKALVFRKTHLQSFGRVNV